MIPFCDLLWTIIIFINRKNQKVQIIKITCWDISYQHSVYYEYINLVWSFVRIWRKNVQLRFRLRQQLRVQIFLRMSSLGNVWFCFLALESTVLLTMEQTSLLFGSITNWKTGKLIQLDTIESTVWRRQLPPPMIPVSVPCASLCIYLGLTAYLWTWKLNGTPGLSSQGLIEKHRAKFLRSKILKR